MRTIYVQRYDNGIHLNFTIRKDNIIEPLHGATVYLKFLDKKDPSIKIKKTCEIIDSELAECRYVLTKEDLTKITEYSTEIEVHYSNGNVLSTLSSPMLLIVSPEIVDDKSLEQRMLFRQSDKKIEENSIKFI